MGSNVTAHGERAATDEASFWARYAPAIVLAVAGLVAVAVQFVVFPYEPADTWNRIDILTEATMGLGALAGAFVVQRLRSSPKVYRPLMAGFTLVFVFSTQDALDEVVQVPEPFATFSEAIPQVLGIAVLALGIARWVAQRNRQEARLEEQADQLGLLGRLIHHDIRNDMSLIKGVAALAEDDVEGSARETLDHIQRTADHTVDLTETAHHLVQLVREGRAATGHRFDLGSVLQNEVDQARRRWPEADIQVAGAIPAGQVQAHQLFPAVVRNLVNNAVQHHDGDAPQVTVEAEAADDHVRLQVRDDGPGIPDARKEELFDSAPRLKADGSGIGLSMVRMVVEQSGGSIRAEDNDPRGTVVEVRLPLV